MDLALFPEGIPSAIFHCFSLLPEPERFSSRCTHATQISFDKIYEGKEFPPDTAKLQRVITQEYFRDRGVSMLVITFFKKGVMALLYLFTYGQFHVNHLNAVLSR